MLSNSGSPHRNLVILCLIVVQFVLSADVAFGGSIVKYLPGLDGELPFTLETGYVSVESAEMFYYFIESEGNPNKDPLLLWYSGGPGCSAFNGLIYQIGPIQFNISDYEGGLPSLNYYPYSWTKSASILFVDAPVGTGFSYSTTEAGWPMSDTKTGLQVYAFLKKWLIEHPQYLENILYVGADSYSGLSAAMVVQHILDGNDYEPRLNLKGYIIGCPKTDSEIQENSKVIYVHNMALISDELYKAAQNSCDSNYYVVETDSQCYVDLQLIKKCIEDISTNHILEPMCTWASPAHIPTEETARRSLRGNPGGLIMSPEPIPKKWCHNFNYSLSYLWANDDAVQTALNVRPGTVQDWKRCNESLDYEYDVTSVLDYHRNFTKMGLQALVYNGDHDLIIPNVGTQEWIRELNLTIDVDWKQWLVDGQVAGYTVKYSQDGYRLTYATVKGAGHSPQEYKRRECFDMFDRFINYYPL